MSAYLVYKNRYNEVKAYEVRILNENLTNTLVIDLGQSKYKTLKTENILSYEDSFKSAEKEANLRQEEYEVTDRYKIGRNFLNREGKLEVCFTGFSSSDKKRLIQLAEQADYFVRTKVTQKLDILVCGDNAGPVKMQKAHQQNVGIVLGVDGFSEFIETGEIAE